MVPFFMGLLFTSILILTMDEFMKILSAIFILTFFIPSIALFNFTKNTIPFSVPPEKLSGKRITRNYLKKDKPQYSSISFKLTHMLNNGSPKNRFDIAIIGDGYTQNDNLKGGSFEKHSKDFLKIFFTTLPFKNYKNKFNIYRIRSVSIERGADPSVKDTVNTVFNSAYGCYGIKRLLVTRNTNQIIRHILNAPECDLLIVMVNSKKYGGSGSRIKAVLNGKVKIIPILSYSADNKSGIQIALHEIGHSIANLADEYVDKAIADNYSIDDIKSKPNVDTTDILRKIKWNIFLRMHPKASGIIGAFEGAYYHAKGVYRPQKHCKMRDIESPFCHICRKELVKAIYRKCGEKFNELQYHRNNPIP